MAEERREQLKQFVERELIGPDPINWEGLRQENGEEILVSDPPRTRYIAGILFPSGAKETNNVDEEKEIVDSAENEVDKIDFQKTDYSLGDTFEVLEDAEELIDRSNAFYQSAMSITVAISNGDSINAIVSAGMYSKSSETNTETGKTTTKYYRKALDWKSDENMELPTSKEPIKRYPVNDLNLQVDITPYNFSVLLFLLLLLLLFLLLLLLLFLLLLSLFGLLLLLPFLFLLRAVRKETVFPSSSLLLLQWFLCDLKARTSENFCFHN